MSAAAVRAGKLRSRRQKRLFDPSRRVGGETRTSPSAPAPRMGPDGSGTAGPTLERMLMGVWEGLAATGSAACPLCGAEMRRGPGRTGGRCGGCGTTLS